MKKCPSCGGQIEGIGALSRKDNKTEICSNCGTMEALEEWKRREDPKEMIEIVTCKDCNKHEYYGAMIWFKGKSYCRRCTYNRWKEESGFKWKPSSTDYLFPKYLDGVDYTKG